MGHYHSPDDLSWDEWRLSNSEVEHIDLEKAASPEEADEREEMTGDEMAVGGYYVVAGIARHEYKQGWKFLTLWDDYGLSEATWCKPFQNPPILNSCASLFIISSPKTQAGMATNGYNTNPRLIEILNSFTVFTDPSVCPY